MLLFRKILTLQLISYVCLLGTMTLGNGSTQDLSMPERIGAVFSEQVFWWGLYLLLYWSMLNPLVFGLLVWFIVALLVPAKPATATNGIKTWLVKFAKSPALPLALQAVVVLISWTVQPQKENVPAAGVGLLVLLFMSLSFLVFRLLERTKLLKKAK